jgi:hypothetical protein
MRNTLNVCLGHLPFPVAFSRHVDLMIAPRLVTGPAAVTLVEDRYFGEHGHALSEYAQLLWFFDHFSAIVGGHEYVRLFQYRRFCADRPAGVRSVNQPWSHAITEAEMVLFDEDFARESHAELFNTPMEFPGKVLGQFAQAHVLSDILVFARFLVDEGILDAVQAAAFLTRGPLIPACNIGVFRSTNLQRMLATLRRACAFLETPAFVVRSSHQRRNMGFMMERLFSHLIFAAIEQGVSEHRFGHNIVISDGPVISVTS